MVQGHSESSRQQDGKPTTAAGMDPLTQDSLLSLNRRFYEQAAQHFDATRQSWPPGLRAILPYFRTAGKERLSVLDVGCGNGRFARLLEEAGISASYTGVDGSRSLLRLAREATAGLEGVECEFTEADLAEAGWARVLRKDGGVENRCNRGTGEVSETPRFSVVLCTATVHHLPGYALRLRLMRDLLHLSAGYVILSFWQFLSSERLRSKLIDPGTVGISATDLEPGDGILPWRQGIRSVRYVHQVDEAELRQMAADSGQTVLHTFRADGKETDLNLYAVLGRAESVSGKY